MLVGDRGIQQQQAAMYFDDRADDKLGKMKDPLAKAVKYIKTRSPKEKLAMVCVAGVLVRKWKAISCMGNKARKVVKPI